MEDNMIRSFVAALVLSLFVAGSASAAKVDVSKLQLAGDITQAQAEIVLKGALAKAVDQGVPMNIAVVDAGGNLKAFLRMDGAFLGSIDVSIGKAETARRFNMSTAALGAAAQFDAKYGENVKVYSIGDFSKEVCGGPHVEHTGTMGHFRIVKEQSSSAGVRRIKAVLEK